jgi:leader peptidase (prepilin peptidase)/N-methyltransferase
MAATFGAACAAFLPRLAYRLAVGFGQPPLEACAHCSRPFPPGLSGFVRVGAACRCTGRVTRVALAGAGTCGLAAALVGPAPTLPIYLLAAGPGLLLALVDLRCLRLPDPLVGYLAITAGVPLAVLRFDDLGRALLAGVMLLTAYGIVALASHGGLGLGDVKLAAVLGLILGFAGWPAVILFVVAAHVLGGVAALVLLLRGRRVLPFGPALLLGALVALGSGGPLTLTLRGA